MPAQAQPESNRFNRLDAKQVHLDAALAGPGAEDDQGSRQDDGRTERKERRSAVARILEVDERQDGEQHASDDSAVHEAGGGVGIAQRVAQANHRHQAEAQEQVRGRHEQWISGRAAHAAHDVKKPEREKEEAHGGKGAASEGGLRS